MTKIGWLLAAGVLLATPSFAQTVGRCPSAGAAPESS